MSTINKILFITLSNMGDVILSLPVVDYLRENFPQSKITVMTGPRTKDLLENNPYIHKLIVFDKYAKLREKIGLFFRLRKERFDVVIDLRNTLYGAMLPARYKTSPFLCMPKHIVHMKERNLYRLKKALKIKEDMVSAKVRSLYINPRDREYVGTLLEKNSITGNFIVISYAAGGAARRWEIDKFLRLSEKLEHEFTVILVGAKPYEPVSDYISGPRQKKRIFDFSGLTTLAQLIALLEKASLVVTADTGTL